jgi:two-component system LytT family response regulator
MIRTVVIDDEPLARGLLVKLLSAQPDIDIVGQAGDGAAAVRLIREAAPDLVFLDIQMPEKDGFEVLEALDPRRIPEVVFVTAYDRYAVKAFEVRALDYLLKPFDEERLTSALARARERLAGRGTATGAGAEVSGAGGTAGSSASAVHGGANASGAVVDPPGPPILSERVAALLEALAARRGHRTRLVIREKDRAFLLPVESIDWIEADGKYVVVHAGAQNYLVRETLQAMEESLDPEAFLRVSRGAVVRIDRIREVRPFFGGDHLVILSGGQEIATTKSYREGLARLFGK